MQPTRFPAFNEITWPDCDAFRVFYFLVRPAPSSVRFPRELCISSWAFLFHAYFHHASAFAQLNPLFALADSRRDMRRRTEMARKHRARNPHACHCHGRNWHVAYARTRQRTNTARTHKGRKYNIMCTVRSYLICDSYRGHRLQIRH